MTWVGSLSCLRGLATRAVVFNVQADIGVCGALFSSLIYLCRLKLSCGLQKGNADIILNYALSAFHAADFWGGERDAIDDGGLLDVGMR